MENRTLMQFILILILICLKIHLLSRNQMVRIFFFWKKFVIQNGSLKIMQLITQYVKVEHLFTVFWIMHAATHIPPFNLWFFINILVGLKSHVNVFDLNLHQSLPGRARGRYYYFGLSLESNDPFSEPIRLVTILQRSHAFQFLLLSSSII